MGNFDGEWNFEQLRGGNMGRWLSCLIFCFEWRETRLEQFSFPQTQMSLSRVECPSFELRANALELSYTRDTLVYQMKKVRDMFSMQIEQGQVELGQAYLGPQCCGIFKIWPWPILGLYTRSKAITFKGRPPHQKAGPHIKGRDWQPYLMGTFTFFDTF